MPVDLWLYSIWNLQLVNSMPVASNGAPHWHLNSSCVRSCCLQRSKSTENPAWHPLDAHLPIVLPSTRALPARFIFLRGPDATRGRSLWKTRLNCVTPFGHNSTFKGCSRTSTMCCSGCNLSAGTSKGKTMRVPVDLLVYSIWNLQLANSMCVGSNGAPHWHMNSFRVKSSPY